MNPKFLLCLALILSSGLLGSSSPDHPVSTLVAETCTPAGKLIVSGRTLYGTTASDSDSWGARSGAVFKVNNDGTGFAVLHHFPRLTYPAQTNWDGAFSESGLQLFGQAL